MAFSLFGKKREKDGRRGAAALPGVPMIRCSICTGEQVAGFRHEDGRFEEVMLIRNAADLAGFREAYGIEGEIEKFY